MKRSSSRWSALATLVRNFITPAGPIPTLSIDELRERLNHSSTQLRLLDVRTAHDYWGPTGHIAGSLNISLEELEHRLSELAADRDRSIALICTTDRRSTKAARMLGRRGFTKVWVVRGGMIEWQRREHPIEPALVKLSTGGKDEYPDHPE